MNRFVDAELRDQSTGHHIQVLEALDDRRDSARISVGEPGG
jgi:hypothetical protein